MNDIKEVEENSISDTELRKYLPGAKIVVYNELKNYKDIEELLPKDKSYFILLYRDSSNAGHWVSLKRTKKGIEYFCSYGTPIDGQLKWYPDGMNKQFGQYIPYLTMLLNKTKLDVFWNDIRYQSNDDDIVTCGRHSIFNMLGYLNDNMDLKKYYNYMKKLKGKGTFDEVVSKRINLILD